MQLRSQQGVAMIAALLTLVLVAGIVTLMHTRTLNEIRHSRDDAAIVQTLLIARSGADLAASVLQSEVRGSLSEIVSITSSTTGRWSYGAGPGCDDTEEEPDVNCVIDDLTVVANMLQSEVDDIFCDQSVVTGSTAGLSVRLYVMPEACGEPLPQGVKLPGGRFVEGEPRDGADNLGVQTYSIPFVMISEGSQGDYRRNIVLQGEYRFPIGRASFARYAYFTNRDTMSDGTNLWFTQHMMIDGPTHTNHTFRFYRNPWFGGELTTAGCQNPGATGCNGQTTSGGIFFGVNNHNVVRPNQMTPNWWAPSYSNSWGTHAPEFAAGVDWDAEFVALPENSQDQRRAAQGLAPNGVTPLLNEGLYIDESLYSLELWAGDSDGEPLSPDGSGGWTPQSEYQYIRSCSSATDCTTYRAAEGMPLEEYDELSETWLPRSLSFNGVIFVEDGIDRLKGPPRNPPGSSNADHGPPAVARFSQLTIATDEDVRIAGDLKYEQPPCTGTPVRNSDGSVTPADCENLSAKNVLGVYTQEGDILIGNQHGDASLNAPDNVTVHAALMTGRGEITVENFRSGAPRGDFNLLGGMTQYYRGAFGVFNASSGQITSGYNRVYTYDQRFRRGVSPPHFPTTSEDAIRGNVIFFSFGQREQLY